jgi:hypothetical protein
VGTIRAGSELPRTAVPPDEKDSEADREPAEGRSLLNCAPAMADAHRGVS